MTQKRNAMHKLQASKFALHDMHLYLDTHPEDLGCIAICKKYESKYALLLNEYEEKYGPIECRNAQGVEWLKNPWPWDLEVCD